MPIAQSETFRRYRAPQDDGQTLVDPPLLSLPDVVSRNRTHLANVDYDVQGRPLLALSASVRRGLLRAAIDYTSSYRDVAFARQRLAKDTRSPLILSGHQPQLFHPGVWYKNFVLGRLARNVGGIGIHFLIDSDLCRSVSLRIPTGTKLQPIVETVPYDAPAAEVPYEERSIVDRDVFDSFGDRAANAIRKLVDAPLVQRLWPLVRKRTGRMHNLGQAVSQGRHLLEADWCNETLELPQSEVCRLPEFAQFSAHLLANLPRFQTAHNAALAEYRRVHRLRNRVHPVPDLARFDDWHEAPLWIWSSDDPRRRAVFARRAGRGIEITDRGQRTIALELTDEGDATTAVAQLMDAESRGIKLRTRALATTLFARLILGDVFLHGIGGAKYDQVTNLIARSFLGFDLPEYATVSATLRLPIPRDPPADMNGSSSSKLRELRYHPERFLSKAQAAAPNDMSPAHKIAAQKWRWIEMMKTPENARQRHMAITAANQALQPYVERQRSEFMLLAKSYDERRQTDAVLSSREYSFCLFPRLSIDGLLLDMPHPRA